MAIREITVDELAAAIDAAPADAPVRLLDVREVSEYDEGHVPGAQLVVLGTVPDNVAAFQGSGPTFVICRSGARSMRACEFLATSGSDGLDDLVNIAGGTLAWMRSGRPIVTGDQPS